jgi:hypothetical protein
MIAPQYRVKPAIQPPTSGIWLGAGGADSDGMLLGSLAETVTGKQPQVWLSTAKEQVVAVVGKRGSGKSFTLGVIAEGLGLIGTGTIARQSQPKAVLLFDPLDVYWTTRFPVAASENKEAQRHFQLAKSAGLADLNFDVQGWIPGASSERPSDPTWFQVLRLPVPDMGIEEWELLLNVNAVTDPMGQAFADGLRLVTELGFQLGSEAIAATDSFDLEDLASVTRSVELGADYHAETLRALRQRLTALHGTGLFSREGTPIRELLAPGRVTVIMLGRLAQTYRSVVVAVLTRLLIHERNVAAFAEKRLALDPELTGTDRAKIEEGAHTHVPRTVVVLDEAQTFLSPSGPSLARNLFIRLVKEGRNMGLSAVLATQQPSALDQRVLSQVETFIAHQLVTEADIRAVRDNLKSTMPETVHFGAQQLDFSALLRQLSAGLSVISAADVNTSARRAMIVNIRPRATVHGGIEL